ncbi:unnamed protein product [Paramecium octaurelia]|uniref:Uncharacterized protein n=1 Tax=Paramecium octaurelia TaxID=43137 RepID=A0A8S1YNJ6_PAROT|nr:unnamed protein product [Paramecium octaurelia]
MGSSQVVYSIILNHKKKKRVIDQVLYVLELIIDLSQLNYKISGTLKGKYITGKSIKNSLHRQILLFAKTYGSLNTATLCQIQKKKDISPDTIPLEQQKHRILKECKHVTLKLQLNQTYKCCLINIMVNLNKVEAIALGEHGRQQQSDYRRPNDVFESQFKTQKIQEGPMLDNYCNPLNKQQGLRKQGAVNQSNMKFVEYKFLNFQTLMQILVQNNSCQYLNKNSIETSLHTEKEKFRSKYMFQRLYQSQFQFFKENLDNYEQIFFWNKRVWGGQCVLVDNLQQKMVSHIRFIKQIRQDLCFRDIKFSLISLSRMEVLFRS